MSSCNNYFKTIAFISHVFLYFIIIFGLSTNSLQLLNNKTFLTNLKLILIFNETFLTDLLPYDVIPGFIY